MYELSAENQSKTVSVLFQSSGRHYCFDSSIPSTWSRKKFQLDHGRNFSLIVELRTQTDYGRSFTSITELSASQKVLTP